MQNPYVQIYLNGGVNEHMEYIFNALSNAPFQRQNFKNSFHKWELRSVSKDKWGKKTFTLYLHDDIYDKIGCLHLADCSDHMNLSFSSASSLPCKAVSFLSVAFYMCRFLEDLNKQFPNTFSMFRLMFHPCNPIYPNHVREIWGRTFD